MRADILIVGQGLAGTLLGWELERAGISFEIADAGHAAAASMAAAGIINPITGRRIVKSWRVDNLLPAARETYRAIESAWGVSIWRDFRVRRLFADEREREVFAEKNATGELAPFAGASEAAGFWIEGAAQIAVAQLLRAARERWQSRAQLRSAAIELRRELDHYGLVIDCRGLSAALDETFSFAPWEFSKGEMIEVAAPDLARDVILNSRHWAVPTGGGTAWVGAMHQPGAIDREPTAAARTLLEASAAKLLGRGCTTLAQRVGVRVNLPDRRPVAGRHPSQERLGLINGLGAKGALWAPLLAREWLNHLQAQAGFDAEISADRFAR